MIPETVKQLLDNAAAKTAANISAFTTNQKNNLFSRNRKLPIRSLISYLITQGSSSTRNELTDFFSLDVQRPGLSAFSQQRAKLKPDGLKNVFDNFNQSLQPFLEQDKYRLLAVDGSDFTFDSFPRFCPGDYLVSQGHSASGFYSLHLNALFDLSEGIYTDAVIQPVHRKDEFAAFCQMADRCPVNPGCRNIYIGDRGYCSYNNMAHVMESGQYFVFRTKDIHSKGLIRNFNLPEKGSFDITVSVSLTRSHSRKVQCRHEQRRFIDKNSSFDYIEYGSSDTYDMTFRVLRFPLPEDTWECIVTNLPEEEFPPEIISELYGMRWGIETSFRKLKYTIGLSNFHAYKPEYVMQEIWARLIAYNATQAIINGIEVNTGPDNKHEYKINFSSAAHICRIFLRLTTEKDSVDAAGLLLKELIPIRRDRKYPRLQTAHFRRPRHTVYRPA